MVHTSCKLGSRSGVGKTHLAAGLARRMVEFGKRAKFFAANALVQDLQQAKLQLQLPAFLKRLDRFDLLVLDDLGYVKKSEAETSVLFELIAYRYERKSLLIMVWSSKSSQIAIVVRLLLLALSQLNFLIFVDQFQRSNLVVAISSWRGSMFTI
jgi:DNA replication protein DnaC